MAANVSYVTFANGMKMPSVGLGTWQSSTDDIKMAVNAALEAGYRHIDGAFIYHNESAIGEVLADWIQSGRVKREELFIVTKLPSMGNRPDRVERYLNDSLKNLRVDYVDLYLIHFPAGIMEGVGGHGTLARREDGGIVVDLRTDLLALWKAMEAQVDTGRVKSIGLSNFNSQQIERVVKGSRIKPANLQVELHAYFQQKPLRALCARHDITVCAYAPLGSPGRFAEKPMEPVGQLLEDPVVVDIAKAHSKTPAQVLLRHLIQQQVVVIPKSISPKRIVENFQVFDFVLNDQEMEALNALDKGNGHRSFTMSGFLGLSDHPEYPFKIPY